jgi:Mn2+/Fe2+ NRAMP family transporter
MQKTARRYLSYLKYFGPGAIIACMTIGAGDIVPIAQQLNDCR